MALSRCCCIALKGGWGGVPWYMAQGVPQGPRAEGAPPPWARRRVRDPPALHTPPTSLVVEGP